jgi:hypothetical protein
MRNYGEWIGEGRRQINNRKITQEATSSLTWLVLVEDDLGGLEGEGEREGLEG